MTQIHNLEITPRDPLVARDGRPFGVGQGNRMRSGDWLLPSVVAGSLRTLLGKQLGGNFDEAMVKALKGTSVAGPLPLFDNQLFFPRPADAVVKEVERDKSLLALRPIDDDSYGKNNGCDLPMELVPALLPASVGDDFKPGKTPAFWSTKRMAEWLADSSGQIGTTSTFEDWGDEYLESMPQEERTHAKIFPDFGAASDGDLFSTMALDFSRTDRDGVIRIALRVQPDTKFEGEIRQLNSMHPCGGERRLVRWQANSKANWNIPESLKVAFAKADQSGIRRVRLVLATPGLFEGLDGNQQGWKPGWLAETEHGYVGCPPGTTTRLRLVSAVVDRWRAISGWSLERGQVGAKAVRRMVPAGATYFLEATGKEPLSDLATNLWLQSVCDNEQDQRDGFGVALWGLWNHHIKEKV